MKTYKHKT